VGPALGLGLIYLFGLKGALAQMLLIGTATPTAVNCMLMCLQFDNHPDYATKAVFYSTLVSPVTVTVVIFLARSGLLPGFAM
jgi:predicted permease